jgi:hypothetical protein
MSSADPQVATLSIGRETIEFRARQGQVGILLERESRSVSRRRGDVTVTQVFLADERNLRGFLQAEPYQDVVKPTLSHIVQSVRAPIFVASSVRPNVEPLEAIRLLANAPDETALIDQMMSIVRPLGADSAFFVLSEQAPDGQQHSHRILTGTNTEAIQTYVAKKWYATDPFLMHASRSHQPFFSSDVGLLENLSGSWRDMGEASRARGLGSWIVMPAHHPGAQRFGALYAANDRLPADSGEEPLRHNRLIFKLLAGELLDWYANQEKAFSLKNSGLTTLELKVLNAIARDERLESIAESIGMSLHVLRRRHIHSINAKLKTKTILEAARLASEQGILAIASERKVGYVIHSDRWGTFLREDFGIPFWSNVNPEGIDEAQLFPDTEAAQRTLVAIGYPAEECQFRRVDVYHTATTASIDDCVAAGVPRWNPSTLHVGAPADDSGTWGTLGAPPVDYH